MVVNFSSNVTRMTYSAWIYPIGAGGSNQSRVISKSSNNTGIPGIIAVSTNASGVLNAVNVNHMYSTVAGIWVTTGVAIQTGQWHHLLVTYVNTDTAQVPQIFINNSQFTAVQVTKPVGVALTDDNIMFVGNRANRTRWFNGIISEVACWSEVLSDEEISLLASSRVKFTPLQVRPSNLLGYWPFDDFANQATASGSNSLIDRSKNSNDGTPSTTATVTGTPEQVLSYQ